MNRPLQSAALAYTSVGGEGTANDRRRIRVEDVEAEPTGYWFIEETKEFDDHWRECGRELVLDVELETQTKQGLIESFRGP